MRRIHWLIVALLVQCQAFAQQATTANFHVTDSPFAQELADAAEDYRSRIATYWFGQPMPKWAGACKLRSVASKSSGQTNFVFTGGEVIGWDMIVRGTQQEVLEDVLPHEVQHTVFASHFRAPLPRWLDEGAATLFESPATQSRPKAELRGVVGTAEWIPFSELLTIQEYPQDGRKLFLLYVEGFAFVDHLVQTYGPEKFIAFIRSGLRSGWVSALGSVYGKSVAQLEREVVDSLRAPHAKSKTRLTARIYSASWCAPCQQMAPFIAKLKTEGLGITKVEEPDEWQRMGVDRLPTIVIFEDGKEIDRSVGYMDEATLRRKLQEHIVRQLGWGADYPPGYQPPQFQRRDDCCNDPNCPVHGGGMMVRPEVRQPMLGIGIPVGPPQVIGRAVPVPRSQPVPGPSRDELRAMVSEFLKANPPRDGRDGEPGAAGPPGENAEVDYAAIVEAVVSQLPVPRDGVDGTPGSDGADGRPADPAEVARYLIANHRADIMGARGPQGPPGNSIQGPIGPKGDRYVAVPDDEAFQQRVDEWLSRNPAVVERYNRVPEMEERIRVLEAALSSQQPVRVLNSDGSVYSEDVERRLVDPIEFQLDDPVKIQ